MLYYKFYIKKKDNYLFSEKENYLFIEFIDKFNFNKVSATEYMKKNWSTIVKIEFGDIYIDFHSQSFDIEFFWVAINFCRDKNYDFVDGYYDLIYPNDPVKAFMFFSQSQSVNDFYDQTLLKIKKEAVPDN